MLSIIIPTLNEENYIPYLLDSIKKQTFKDYEVLVADADSKDNTVEIVKERGHLVVKGGLPATGRNNAAKKAKGDLLLFLDADVILPPDFLEKVMKEFKNYKLDIASCFILPLSNKKIDDLLYKIGNLYYKTNERFTPRAPGYCILIKKELHEKIKGFDEKIKMAEDWDYVIRASYEGQFKFLDSAKIPLSMRRFERDGRLNVSLQRLTEVIYISLFGNIKSNSFLKDYRFGNYPKSSLKPHVENYDKLLKSEKKKND